MCSILWVVANKPSSSQKGKQSERIASKNEKVELMKVPKFFGTVLELSENLDQELLLCEMKNWRSKTYTSNEVNSHRWHSWLSSLNLDQKFQILLNLRQTSFNLYLKESNPDPPSRHVILLSHPSSFQNGHFETIYSRTVSILSGFLALTFKRRLEAR